MPSGQVIVSEDVPNVYAQTTTKSNFHFELSSFDVVNNVNFGNTQNETEQFYLELLSGNYMAMTDYTKYQNSIRKD